jgi:hypothetical protein
MDFLDCRVVCDRGRFIPAKEFTPAMTNLLKRDKGRNTYSVRIEIPARLQHAFLNAKGQPKRTLVKSLGTTNKVEAKERAALVVARWRCSSSRPAVHRLMR